MTTPDILFIGHGAERSGPPIFMGHLQRALSRHDGPRFATVLALGGPLVSDFEALGPVRVVDDGWTPGRIVQQGLARLGRDRWSHAITARRDRRTVGDWRRAGLVYVNTLSPETVRLTDAVVADGATLVAHVHEMEAALRYRIPPAYLAALLERADRIVAASAAVGDNLVANHGVDADRIVIHHEFVEPVVALSPDDRTVQRVAHGIDPSAFVVVGSGQLEWRKGPDHFVRIAHEFRRCHPDQPTQFVWVGGATAGPEWWPHDHDVRQLGLQDVVSFVGDQEDAGSWFRLADAFALTSREDAYPLAVLEAASAGVPFVGFATGGMVEFAEQGAGTVVPYPDAGAFVDALGELTEAATATAAAGRAQRAAESHHADTAAAALVADIERWVESR